MILRDGGDLTRGHRGLEEKRWYGEDGRRTDGRDGKAGTGWEGWDRTAGTV